MIDNNTPDDDERDPNVIAIERDSKHPYEDFSDMYENVFDNPAKHANDLRTGVIAGFRSTFEALLPKVDNHGEIAALAFAHGNPQWSDEVVQQYPDADYQEYFEALLKANHVQQALELWDATPNTTLSKTSLAFEKQAYEQIGEEYRSDFRQTAEDNLSQRLLVDRVVRSGDAQWVQRQIDNGVDFELTPEQIAVVVDQNMAEVVDVLMAANPKQQHEFVSAARLGNPAMAKALVVSDAPPQEKPKPQSKQADTTPQTFDKKVKEQRAKMPTEEATTSAPTVVAKKWNKPAVSVKAKVEAKRATLVAKKWNKSPLGK